MTRYLLTLPALALLAFAQPAAAQQDGAAQTDTDATAETAEQQEPGVIGAPADGLDANGDPVVGSVYETEQGDWLLQCEKTLADTDPCRMYQLLVDEGGNSVAEVELRRVEGGTSIMVFTVPLGTLLSEQLTIVIDGGRPGKLPFMYCDRNGCFSRVNLRAEDINSFKRGNMASITIVPVQAPDETVTVPMSLTGFTAAFDATPELARGG